MSDIIIPNPYIKKELKIFTVTHTSPVETVQATPTSLPTSEGTTPTKEYSLTDSDFPSISPSPYVVSYTAIIVLGGKNTDTASQTVHWEIKLNGSSIVSSSLSVSAGYYWTVQEHVDNVKSGDVIDVYLWASATSVNWSYDMYLVRVYHLRPVSDTLIYSLSVVYGGKYTLSSDQGLENIDGYEYLNIKSGNVVIASDVASANELNLINVDDLIQAIPVSVSYNNSAYEPDYKVITEPDTIYLVV